MKQTTKSLCCMALAALLQQSAHAQVTLTDLGGTPYSDGAVLDPTPGANDISQMSYGSQNNDGLNYYFDNNTPPGQTFTTGSNPGGYTLTNLCIKTAGNGNNATGTQGYHLFIYSVSGSTATLIQTYTGTTGFQENHWFNISGLSTPLNPNAVYAYALHRDSNGWEQMANQDGNPYADGEICLIPQAGGAINFGTSHNVDAAFDVGLALGTVAASGSVTFKDNGYPGNPATIVYPEVGANDIAQTNSASQSGNGLNYYFDNNNPPGQTFTTGPSATGWVLSSVTVKTSGGGGGGQTGYQGYHLFIYSVSADDTTATLIATYTGGCSFTEQHWLQWTNLTTPLQANKKYAYAFHRDSSGWELMGTQTGNPYAGGDMCCIPQGGGTINYGSGKNLVDATFVVGLVQSLAPVAGPPTYSPPVANIYAGSTVILNEDANGGDPKYYQWLSDDGLGGTFVPVGNFTTNQMLPVDTTGFTAGAIYNYQVVVTNAWGASTSSIVALNIVPASSPLLITNWVTPNTMTNFVGLSHIFAAEIEGTLPISYQWQISPNADGSGAVNIPGATNSTLSLNNLQLTNSGYYSVVATNIISPFVVSTPWTQLAVVPFENRKFKWQSPVSFASLTPAQIVDQPGWFYEAAGFGPGFGGGAITVTAGTNVIVFSNDGSAASVAGYHSSYTGLFASPLTTGDTNLDHVLNSGVGNGDQVITLHNLVVGNEYIVQLFAVKHDEPARTVNFQDPNNAANISETFAEASDKYVIGTFTAENTDESIKLNFPLSINGGPGLGAMNAIIVRSLTPPPPSIAWNVSGNTLTLTWPSGQGWTLLSQTNSLSVGLSGTWYTNTAASDGSYSITIDPTKPAVFYRLIK